jgi:hypothetical protein
VRAFWRCRGLGPAMSRRLTSAQDPWRGAARWPRVVVEQATCRRVCTHRHVDGGTLSAEMASIPIPEMFSTDVHSERGTVLSGRVTVSRLVRRALRSDVGQESLSLMDDFTNASAGRILQPSPLITLSMAVSAVSSLSWIALRDDEEYHDDDNRAHGHERGQYDVGASVLPTLCAGATNEAVIIERVHTSSSKYFKSSGSPLLGASRKPFAM